MTETHAPRPRRHRRLGWLLLPIPVAVVQLVGVRGAANWGGRDDGEPPWWHRDTDQVATVSPFAYLLALLGPLCLLGLRRFPRSVVAATAVIAATYYSLALPPGPVFLAPLVAIFGWIKMVRAERVAEQRRVAAAEAARAAGAERLRIAQELHDVLAHHISLINVQSGVALHLVDQRPEQARTALTAIKGASKEALTALRGALDALRNIDDTAPRSPTAGLAQLDDVVAAVRSAGMTVTVEVTGETAPLDPAVDLAALRIVQESLTNVVRHSGADAVEVTVEHRPDALRVTVRDNGRGGVPVPGNGITGMWERAAAVGGELRAGPAPGGGFQVGADLPIH